MIKDFLLGLGRSLPPYRNLPKPKEEAMSLVSQLTTEPLKTQEQVASLSTQLFRSQCQSIMNSIALANSISKQETGGKNKLNITENSGMIPKPLIKSLNISNEKKIYGSGDNLNQATQGSPQA